MYEIHLVPDVKAQMIKAQKTRNLVFFIAAAISAISIGMVVILAGIRGGQELRINGQDNTLELMSKKLNDFDGLEEVLTIKSQLNNLEEIRAKKKSLSRIFSIISAMQPTGSDRVTISSLDINLADSTMNLEGQANAGEDTDGIDYRVLESFMKQVSLMKFDYGRYVDRYGNEIPTMCIKEADDNVQPYTDLKGRLFAYWTKSVKGCDPSVDNEDSIDEDELSAALSNAANGSSQTVATILRTPNFDNTDPENWDQRGYIDLDGNISGVEHFESECIKYTGIEYNGKRNWPSTNECYLAPDGIEITSSSNGRQSGGDLVLRFTGTLYFNDEIFDFNNKHLVAIAPSGRTNVTDSLLQLESIFSEKAMDCDDGDTACRSGN